MFEEDKAQKEFILEQYLPDSLALWIGRVEKGVLWFPRNCGLGAKGLGHNLL